MKTIVHVNQHVIRSNVKNGCNDPVLTVKNYKSNEYAHSVDILDAGGVVAARVIYSPDRPLSCGARVWIETNNGVIVHLTPFPAEAVCDVCAD
jgi:hypothetical protein